MYPIVSVLADARQASIVFADEESAQAFIAFIRLYIKESGAGNGYGAYWHWGEEPLYSKTPRTGDDIKVDLIRDMCWSICRARLATDNSALVRAAMVTPIMDSEQGMWTFAFNPQSLPARQVPGINDMCRVIEHEKFGRRDARVVTINGGEAVINLGWGDTERHTVPLQSLMKIFDYEMRR